MAAHWARGLKLTSMANRVGSRRRVESRRRLWMPEVLEDRVLLSGNPTIYNVTDLGDSATDTGSLRYAITQANADPNLNGSEIDFSALSSQSPFSIGEELVLRVGSTLTLSELAGPMAIVGLGASSLEIDGDTSAVYAVHGGFSGSIFSVANGVNATISGLTIIGANSPSFGGGIYNNGNLALINSTIGYCQAEYGGAIANLTVLTVTGSTFIGSSASKDGGGIFNGGALTMTGSTVSGNTADQGGGISNLGTLTITPSTISGNQAISAGDVARKMASRTWPGTPRLMR